MIASVKERKPLVHCITNYVTVNDVANMVLACGGSPIMADDAAEAAEITSICDALVINIGTLNARTVESMLLAGVRANALGHPVILDPVGAGASAFRTKTTLSLLERVKFAVIRGNSSEIKAAANGIGNTRGVDAAEGDAATEDNLAGTVVRAKALSKETGAVIAITGAIDIVTNEAETYVCRNGVPEMSRITGTGCMLDGMIAAYVAANPDEPVKAAAAAVSVEGFAGELALERVRREDGGLSSLRTYLIDAVGRMDAEIWQKGAKVAVFEG